MPRRPSPKSKTPRIVIEAKTEEELMKLRGLREIFSREEPGTMRKELWEAITHLLAKHNWPPGNPQSMLTSFGVQTKIMQQCQYPNCHEIASYECVPDSPYAQKKVYYCQEHRDHAKENRLLKASKRL